mmetsp:Transcript_16688/g.47317  ORF Transcript_16688/g.47317 Transcript_16688/m.47317 type:complete len:406 (+) Transcript_16688:136-1353(+)
MQECVVIGAGESCISSVGSCWESWQHGDSCLDTSLFQAAAFLDTSLKAVQVAAWTAADKAAEAERRLGNPVAPVSSNIISLLAQAHHTGTVTNASVWALLLAVAACLLVAGCVFCSSSIFERSATSLPTPAGAPKKKGGARTVSATSLSSDWPRQGQPVPASSRSPGSTASVQSSARRPPAGRAMSMKIKSNGSSVAHPLGTGSANGGQHGTLHSCVSACADHSPSSQEPVRKKTEGCLFTVPVDVMVGVNLTGKGSFTIKDTCSSLVLRGAVPKNSDGSRKVQVFQGEDGTTPCASVEPLPSGPQAILNSFQIRGADNMLLGSLVLQNSGEFVVHCHEQPELVIEGNDADVDLQVSSRDGRPKASVSCKASHPGGMDQVEIHVLPGTDPVLIVACTLAILFLCG